MLYRGLEIENWVCMLHYTYIGDYKRMILRFKSWAYLRRGGAAGPASRKAPPGLPIVSIIVPFWGYLIGS